MRSSLTWLDHDPAARERSLRILALFQERGSREELGLGAIRDSFSDKLFPGTSTIQTRLRYMLLVPWVYRSLEDRRISSASFAARARRLELRLVAPLLDSDDRGGVFGISAGKALKRLPSEVYWAGLGEWGIRRFPGSLEDYHRSVDRIYASRSPRREHADDDEAVNAVGVTWHPKLPEPPEGFPDALTLRLTREEAEFLRDCIVTSCPQSLLAWLAREGRLVKADRPWEHPDRAKFPEPHRALLEHAGLFSEVMLGAARLYNLTLAELDGRSALVEEHRKGFADWAIGLDSAVISSWSLEEMWLLLSDPRHNITSATRRFVESWVKLVRDDAPGLADNKSARLLIERRERQIKKSRSRNVNTRLREQWGGQAGLRPMVYRWPTVQAFMEDLYQGLRTH